VSRDNCADDVLAKLVALSDRFSVDFVVFCRPDDLLGHAGKLSGGKSNGAAQAVDTLVVSLSDPVREHVVDRPVIPVAMCVDMPSNSASTNGKWPGTSSSSSKAPIDMFSNFKEKMSTCEIALFFSAGACVTIRCVVVLVTSSGRAS
jgi:hypothetical protein